jgi:two-component system response regulator GlrR
MSGAASLQLRALVDDVALLRRARQLLSSLGRCTVQRDAREPMAGGSEPAPPGPSAVVIALDASAVPACCAMLDELLASAPGVPLIVLAHGIDTEGLAELLAHGAFDYADLSDADGAIQLRLRRALGLLPAPRVACREDTPFASLQAHLVGRAPAFIKLLRRVPVTAASDASVLLLGETGTGKEACAQAIHYISPRSRGPWVAINCAAIPAELLENELFGHVRGAYTHAQEARHGLVHEAEGGTLFLDEIDSTPLAAQAKLLRFLQDKQYRMVGAGVLRTADVRVIAASNRDLRQVVAGGGFRADLYYRLNVLSLTLPPLRERREDIPALALHFMAQASREFGRRTAGITPGAMRCLVEHAWPGNVRELKHVLQRAVLLAQGETLKACDIEIDGVGPAVDETLPFREAKARAVEAFEQLYIRQLLAQSNGNITRAARAAQKNRRAFFELLRRHEIDAATYRDSPAL